jgi:hypothetical protein
MGGMDGIGLAEDGRTLVKAVMNLWVPYNAGKSLSDCTIGGLSSTAQLRIISLLVMKKP